MKQELLRSAIERIDSEIREIWNHIKSSDEKMNEKISVLKDHIEFLNVHLKEKEHKPSSSRLPERFNVENCLNYLKKQVKAAGFPQPELYLLESTKRSIRAYLVIRKDENYFAHFLKFGELLNETNERYDIELNISLYTRPEFAEICDIENIQETSILHGEA